MPDNDESLYETLGIPEDADDEAIKRAYKKAASRTHPDREGGDEERFKEVKRAYMILSDPDLRHRYDSGESPDDTYQLNPREQAVQNIGQLLNSLVESNLDKIESYDLLGDMRKVIKEKLAPVHRDLKKFRAQVKKLNLVLTRLKRKKKGGTKLFEMVIERQRDTVLRNIETCELAIEISREMEMIVDEYEFEFDKPDWTYSTNSLYGGGLGTGGFR